MACLSASMGVWDPTGGGLTPSTSGSEQLGSCSVFNSVTTCICERRRRICYWTGNKLLLSIPFSNRNTVAMGDGHLPNWQQYKHVPPTSSFEFHVYEMAQTEIKFPNHLNTRIDTCEMLMIFQITLTVHRWREPGHMQYGCLSLLYHTTLMTRQEDKCKQAAQALLILPQATQTQYATCATGLKCSHPPLNFGNT